MLAGHLEKSVRTVIIFSHPSSIHSPLFYSLTPLLFTHPSLLSASELFYSNLLKGAFKPFTSRKALVYDRDRRTQTLTDITGASNAIDTEARSGSIGRGAMSANGFKRGI